MFVILSTYLEKISSSLVFFSTALVVDEMMVRFFSRTSLKQYLPSKPDRYGLKFWGLCDVNGYIFDLDIYGGKRGDEKNEKLASCALGSTVVLQMVNKLLMDVSKRKLCQYHLYMDNFFTSPDLLVHLMKNGLKATGTVRRNRIEIKHEFDKKAVKAASVSPIKPLKRYSSDVRNKAEIRFPSAFVTYNKFMGGVDTHDFRCKKLYQK
ncbi:piggyBac transposable element-derived protein 3 [Nasonia vitripennis]|uniref:PiggyBac transposable element-derived protein domain-containing protein n=1 Tax=Nasonia vitripennis TaxID=7425 RepID=A0A7M7Q701_NASVI|nr:piggyBac transposable element-derived protein 3 [Nasonia vitripennis]